jgi:hypothetical protein
MDEDSARGCTTEGGLLSTDETADGKTDQWETGTNIQHAGKKKTPWPESESELYRLSDRSLSVKLVPTFADKG